MEKEKKGKKKRSFPEFIKQIRGLIDDYEFQRGIGLAYTGWKEKNKYRFKDGMALILMWLRLYNLDRYAPTMEEMSEWQEQLSK